MSYTPPAGNAINFNFTGTAYTPPVGSSLVFDLASEGAPTLVVASATHTHTADNAALSTSATLQPHDSSHTHLADTVVLAAVQTLVANDVLHPHGADQVALASTVTLVVQGASHPHTADNAALSLARNLVAHDTAHTHTASHVRYSAADDEVALLHGSVFARTVDEGGVVRLMSKQVEARVFGTHTMAADPDMYAYIEEGYILPGYYVDAVAFIHEGIGAFVRSSEPANFVRIQ